MCKYNKEENKLLGIPEDELCILETIAIQRRVEELQQEIIKALINNTEKDILDYYNIKHIPRDKEDIEEILTKVENEHKEKYKDIPYDCKPETVKACKEAEQCLACKRKDCEGCLLNK